jgi:hypothetical protein
MFVPTLNLKTCLHTIHKCLYTHLGVCLHSQSVHTRVTSVLTHTLHDCPYIHFTSVPTHTANSLYIHFKNVPTLNSQVSLHSQIHLHSIYKCHYTHKCSYTYFASAATFTSHVLLRFMKNAFPCHVQQLLRHPNCACSLIIKWRRIYKLEELPCKKISQRPSIFIIVEYMYALIKFTTNLISWLGLCCHNHKRYQNIKELKISWCFLVLASPAAIYFFS